MLTGLSGSKKQDMKCMGLLCLEKFNRRDTESCCHSTICLSRERLGDFLHYPFQIYKIVDVSAAPLPDFDTIRI